MLRKHGVSCRLSHVKSMPLSADTIELLLVRHVGSCPQVEMQSSDLNVFSCTSGILCAFCLPGHQLDIWQ